MKLSGQHFQLGRARFRSTFFITLILLLMCIFSASVQAQYNYTGFNFYYTNSEGIWAYSTNGNAITITGYSGTNTSPAIPELINGWPVTDIGDIAFENDTNLAGIILPDTVTNIGFFAFSGTGLTNLIIPNSVITIGVGAFGDCEELAEISFGTNVTMIGQDAFGNCFNLNNVVLPASIKDIGSYAFGGCDNLTNVVIPSSVTNIQENAFSSCQELTTVTLPKNVSDIGPGVFALCSSLQSINMDQGNQFYSSSGGVLFDKNQDTLVEYPGGLTGIYTIPNTVTNIGSEAFDGAQIYNLIITNSVVAIQSNAFFGAYSLSSITIPNSVTQIGYGAFVACNNLRQIIVSTDNPAYTSVNGVLFDKLQHNLVAYPPDAGLNIPYSWFPSQSYTIPNGVTNIDSEAFQYNFSLTNIIIPNSVLSIGDSAFFGCSGLTNITLPNSVTYIGNSAFNFCYNLADINIPNSVSTIGNSAFQQCSSLANITLGSSVTSIGNNAFGMCLNLTNIMLDNSLTNIGEDAFSGTTIGKLAIPNGMTSISEFAFANMSLNGITIPETVTNIGLGAFEDCSNLTDVVFSNGVTSIGGFAFYNTALGSVTIPASVTNIGVEAFAFCNDLTAINVNESNSDYASLNGVLYDHNMTTLIAYPEALSGSFTVPDGVTLIAPNAFANSYDLTSVTMPESIFGIGFNAFLDCADLTNVFFTGNEPLGDISVFFGDNGTAYYLPGTTGWERTFGGLPTALWLPQMQTNGGVGVKTNQFGFNINWAPGQTVVVEATTNLANPVWVPIATNTLSSSSSSFTDPQWTNYPGRYYRLSSP